MMDFNTEYAWKEKYVIYPYTDPDA